MSGFEKDFTVKIEKEEYEVIQNVDVKQEIVDDNINYYQSTSNAGMLGQNSTQQCPKGIVGFEFCPNIVH